MIKSVKKEVRDRIWAETGWTINHTVHSHVRVPLYISYEAHLFIDVYNLFEEQND